MNNPLEEATYRLAEMKAVADLLVYAGLSDEPVDQDTVLEAGKLMRRAATEGIALIARAQADAPADRGTAHHAL